MSVIRFGIAVLVVFAVLAHGVVEPWSEGVLEVGAGLLLLIWILYSFANDTAPLVWNVLLCPLVAFLIFGLCQLVAGGTMVPFLTRIELLKALALFTLFFLTVQSYRTRAQWHGFVWFLLILSFAVSLFGILQHFTFNGKLYWFRELRYGGIPFGPYVNRNHFAGLVELLIPPGVAILVLRGERRDQLPLVALFTLIPIGALFLAASRGGIMSFLAEMALLAFIVFLRRREKKQLAGALIILALGVLLVSWLGVGRALDRFATYKSLETSESRRVEMLHDTWKIFKSHPIRGTGVGTLQEVFPRYASFYDGLIVNHSHNDYAEALAETGILGGICGLAFLFLLFWKAWKRIAADRDTMTLAFHCGALVACLGLLVHGTVDFNFHIPSNALLFLLQAALATSSMPADGSSRSGRTR